MSNAMSRSKSRWKGALLATVAAAAVTPLAAKAGMTIDLSTTPLGPASSAGYSLMYVNPHQTSIPIYVYATITGTGTPATSAAQNGTSTLPSTSGDFSGLQYAYYNINDAVTNAGSGSITNAQMNSVLGFNSGGNDVSGTSVTGAAQNGTLQNVVNGVAVGSVAGNMTDFAKARAGQPVWSNAYNLTGGTTVNSFADGTNIVPGAPNGLGSSHSVSFLLETLTYNPGTLTLSTPTAINSIRYSAFVPTNVSSPSIASTYAPANIFTDSSSSAPATGGSLAAVTSSVATAGAGVTFVSDMAGDCNGDGIVNITDFNILTGNFNQTGNWSQGNFNEGSSTKVNITDFNELTSAFNQHIGPNPAGGNEALAAADAPLYNFAVAHDDVAGFLAAGGVAPVPEPTSIGLVILSGSALLARRSRRKMS